MISVTVSAQRIMSSSTSRLRLALNWYPPGKPSCSSAHRCGGRASEVVFSLVTGITSAAGLCATTPVRQPRMRIQVILFPAVEAK